MIWQVLTLIAAVFKAVFDLSIKKILKKEQGDEASLNIYLVALPMVLLLVPFVEFQISGTAFFLLLLRSVLLLIGTIFFYKTVKNTDLYVVAPLYNLIPIFVLIFGFLLLDEVLCGLEYFGVLLLVLGSFIIRNEDVSSTVHSKFFK